MQLLRFLVINGHVYVREYSISFSRTIEATFQDGVPAYDFNGGRYLIRRKLDPKDFIEEPDAFVYGRDVA